ncbi:hypothetical protein [Bacillus sp. OV322]|uniref:hypothetical protein n=1 Tax=Bacillus sp. OV322 TaxID=1882764 RepID=UPI000B838DFA|nr:hypothetical protein [Bacillus sp. OV322]
MGQTAPSCLELSISAITKLRARKRTPIGIIAGTISGMIVCSRTARGKSFKYPAEFYAEEMGDAWPKPFFLVIKIQNISIPMK